MTAEYGMPADEVLPCGCLMRCTVVDGVDTVTIIIRTDCRILAPEFRRAL